MTLKQLGFGTLAVVITIFVVMLAFNLAINVNAKEVAFVQFPWGTLSYYNTQGPKPQFFGSYSKFLRRGQFWFSAATDQGNQEDQSIKVRFNDGAHGWISGSLSYELPIDDEATMTTIYRLYSSPDALEHQLIRTVVEKAVYLTGPLMSSKESYAEKRNDLIRYIDDQVIGGVYKTTTKNVQDKDPITGQPRTFAVTEIVKNADGSFARQDESPITRFKIRISNLSINSLKYEDRVENQIVQQQNALQQVQIAQAQSKEAEQQALTASKQGEAKAMTAKWEQEVIKARAVTEAQQKLEVARLQAAAAAQYKIQQTLEGEGDAAKKRLVMSANGALTEKLEAWKFAQEKWAAAWAQNGAQITPYIVNGGGATGSSVGAASLENFLGIQNLRALKELGLNMDIKKQ